MSQEKIVVAGAGGHGKVVVSTLKLLGSYELAGITDPNHELHGKDLLGVPVVGGDDLLAGLYSDGVKNAAVGVGSIRDTNLRKSVYETLKKHGFNLPFIISPSSILSDGMVVGKGCQLMAGSIVQTGCDIGENSVINTGTVIEHDCKIGKHVFVGPGSVIAGEARVGDGAFVGVGAVILQGINIGESAVIGAGAVVIKDVGDGETVVGVPAKPRSSQ